MSEDIFERTGDLITLHSQSHGGSVEIEDREKVLKSFHDSTVKILFNDYVHEENEFESESSNLRILIKKGKLSFPNQNG